MARSRERQGVTSARTSIMRKARLFFNRILVTTVTMLTPARLETPGATMAARNPTNIKRPAQRRKSVLGETPASPIKKARAKPSNPRTRHQPMGVSRTATMKPTATTSLTRASSRWSELEPPPRSSIGSSRIRDDPFRPRTRAGEDPGKAPAHAEDDEGSDQPGNGSGHLYPVQPGH